MTLTEFLLARIAEDEAPQQADRTERYGHGAAWHRLDCGLNTYNSDPCDCDIPARVLAECAAKRRIVERYAYLYEHGDSGDMRWVLPLLALPYADHPDYREEWRP